MAMNNGVMTMRPLDKGLAIEPGKTVKLAPGGYHLMLMDLKSPLKQGDKVPVTLEFEKAGKVKLSLDVQGVGAQAPGAGHSGGHDAGSFRHEEVRPNMSKIIFLAAVATLAASPAAAHVSLENRQATVGAVVQGGIHRAAWLRRLGHDKDPRANSRRRDRGQADAEGRLERRGDQRQIRHRIRAFTAGNFPKASRKWCGAAASWPTAITTSSS